MDTCYIRLENVSFYKEGHLLRWVHWGTTVRILKVYRPNWWRKLLVSWGFDVRINQIKVIY